MPITTRAAVVRGTPGEYETATLRLDEPRSGEVLVRLVSAGLCHSDDHVATGDIPYAIYPVVGGHEGAGIVEQVGDGVSELSVGDHIIFSYLAVCGRCRWCAAGMQNLCDQGIAMQTGARPDDPSSYRLTEDGAPVGQMGGLGTFSEYSTVSAQAAIKIDKSAPLDKVSLLGCGVCTGWGSAVNSAAVRIGDTVIVMGIGGIGSSAVQGALHAGASHVIAVDPLAFKRDFAVKLGASHAVQTIAEAGDVARGLTNGQGADAAIVTVGVVTGQHIADAFSTLRKAGTVVVTSVSKSDAVGIPVPLPELTFFQKRIQGALFGASNPTYDIPKMLRLYQEGQFDLDNMITTTYSLDQVAQGYRDLHAGTNIRGVVIFD
ncbi:MAG TPA: NDMA-dependent alcohol dehydrogenase [Pseudonocardia sp.]|uniref:NDMA-dependent alcohol dehydrogenase n=1 Tax=Pseudonocardia sp. TaxID=60912 RepID=UPI002C539665|nr:NDMA-dependent alcohol dehydrogenase [Pseudonocardia sp.]HTF47486.1 NDMA-dependent alcohol dehydrogenase [Pseudonocardia sp.]